VIISEALSVEGRGHKLFELMCAHDLEGVVAKRLKDGYGSRVRWLKIKNPGYSQNEGRRELFVSVTAAARLLWLRRRRDLTVERTGRCVGLCARYFVTSRFGMEPCRASRSVTGL
jgi:hypothetical protein